MSPKLRRMSRQLAAAGVLGSITGCQAISTEPLAPPIVRNAACELRAVGHDIEDCMSPEYHEWWCEVKHFCGDTKREFIEEYRVNEEWPRPHTELAAAAVYQPLGLQSENARIQLASIWDYHFEMVTGQLNAMGRKRVGDIVDQADTLGRVIYVRRAANTEENNARLESVRTEVDRLTQDVTPIEVVPANASQSSVEGHEAQKAMKLLSSGSAKGAADTKGNNSGSGSSGTSNGATGSGSK